MFLTPRATTASPSPNIFCPRIFESALKDALSSCGVERDSSSVCICSNSPNSVSRLLGEIPQPVSSTAISISHFPFLTSAVQTSIFSPPLVVCLTAFATTLLRTSRNRVGSPLTSGGSPGYSTTSKVSLFRSASGLNVAVASLITCRRSKISSLSSFCPSSVLVRSKRSLMT